MLYLLDIPFTSCVLSDSGGQRTVFWTASGCHIVNSAKQMRSIVIFGTNICLSIRDVAIIIRRGEVHSQWTWCGSFPSPHHSTTAGNWEEEKANAEMKRTKAIQDRGGEERQ